MDPDLCHFVLDLMGWVVHLQVYPYRGDSGVIGGKSFDPFFDPANQAGIRLKPVDPDLHIHKKIFI